MKAIVITQFGGPEVLQIEERPLPTIGENEVLVKVKAAGINRPDIFQRKGNYPAPPDTVQDIPGLEIAGEVKHIGVNVKNLKIGDKVCCLVAGGGYAEYIAVHEGMCLPIPKGCSLEQAASLPETIYTVWDNVFRRGRLKAGESILIHGGAGGIGSTAIQLAKAMGAEVYTTAGSDDKVAYCKKLGASHAINYKTADFVQQWKGKRIDVVLDSIGGTYFNKNMSLLREDGRLVYINAVEGTEVSLNIFKLMQKRITITGSTLRARSLDFKIELTAAVKSHVWPLIGKEFIPQVQKTFPLDEAGKAHEMLDSGAVHGKVVLYI